MQRIVPYLAYSDASAAIAFLTRAFGFAERSRYPMADGRIGHAELEYQGDVVMLADFSEAFGTSPLNLPNVHGQVYCLVDDVDAHFERAKTAGATIVAEPAEQHGERIYRAMDPEGHRWIFASPAGAR
jgi:PhnB protein